MIEEILELERTYRYKTRGGKRRSAQRLRYLRAQNRALRLAAKLSQL